MLGPDEMKAIVDEAHSVRRKVAAHATGPVATRIAAEAGVDSMHVTVEELDRIRSRMPTPKLFG
jgi:imidazolonepropionase-like amidohydrolase